MTCETHAQRHTWRYSVVVITRDSDSVHLPETQVRTLVAPLFGFQPLFTGLN